MDVQELASLTQEYTTARSASSEQAGDKEVFKSVRGCCIAQGTLFFRSSRYSKFRVPFARRAA